MLSGAMTEETKVSFLVYWLGGKREREERFISQEKYEKLTIEQEEDKNTDSIEQGEDKNTDSFVESYWTLLEEYMATKANELLFVFELRKAQQGNMTSEDFYTKVSKLVEDANSPNEPTKQRAIRDAVVCGINSREKAIQQGNDVYLEFIL